MSEMVERLAAAIALRAPSPLGLRPEPASGLGHAASVNYRKGDAR